MHLGDDLPGTPEAQYKRRIGPWLLWRAGPATKADARYWAAHVDTLESAGTDWLAWPTVVTFRLHADGTATGTGPSGTVHQRFRSWKEDPPRPPDPAHQGCRCETIRTMEQIGRRSLIVGAAAAVATLRIQAAGLALPAATRTARIGADQFTLGVATGDPTSTGFVAWTRLAPDPDSGGSPRPGRRHLGSGF